jgi:WD40 repeat protein
LTDGQGRPEPTAYRVDWSSDNKFVAVGYGLRKSDAHQGEFADIPAHIRLFDPNDWSLLRDFAPHKVRVYALDFSPDGTVLASGGQKQIFLWDPATGEQLMALPEHGDEVTSTRWSDDGRLLITCAGSERHDSPNAANNGNFNFPGKDRKVRIWRVAE